jgi:hypothetical protein
VGLDLVDRRRGFVVVDQIDQAVGVAVADTDGPDQALAVQLLHDSPGAVVIAERLVDQVMMPGLSELSRAPRSPQSTLAACTRRMLARLARAYAAPELVTVSGCRNGSRASSPAGILAAQSSGRIGECSHGVMGGDVDACGGGREAGCLQGVSGRLGGVLFQVGQQDRLVDADSAGDRLAHRTRAEVTPLAFLGSTRSSAMARSSPGGGQEKNS